ncbi:MAG: hypothetical protein GX446_12815, partial [Chthonomonadales bacterium]|nr:hypothetical protein [Chthonomonadales bacterium]
GADALTWGYLAAALGAIWAGPVLLLRANRTADMNPASAIFGRCSAAAYGIAGILTSLHALSCVGNAVSISGPGWDRLAVLSGICTAAYAFAAWITRRPTVMYAASGGAALTFGVLASAWLRTTTFQPLHHAGHDLALASLAPLAIGASVARRSTVDRTADQHERTAPDWSTPWLSSGALLAALAIVVALAWTSTRGVDAGTWVAIAAATAGSAIAFAGVLRYTERTTAQALLTASLAGCVALMGLAGNATPFAVGTAAALMASAWLFAVAAFPMRHRADSLWITPLRGMAVIAYVAASGALSVRYPGMADRYLAQTPYLVHSGYVLAAAAIGFAWIGALRKEHEPTATALAAVSLLHCWLLHGIHPTAAISAQCAVASAACSVAFGLRASRELAAAPWLSAIAGALAWYGLVRWIGRPLQDWTALAMLPGIAGLYALSECAALPYELRFAARRIAVATFIVSAVSSEASGLVLGFPHSRIAPTMGAYTVAAAVAATRRASVNWTVTASACWSLTAAHGAAWFDLPDAVWAFAFVACAIPYPVTVFFMGRAGRWSPVRSFVGAVAATHLAIGVLAALEAATATDLGSVSIVAIALAGLLLASLFTVGLGAPYAHASAACFMVANAMIVYDRVSISAGVLDLYLIPVGAYLLVLGHLADRRVRADEAKGLWWTGALVVMTPTFIAFWTHFSEGGPVWHALLLVAECLAAVLWGIANRIRAFVITGGAYALAFAAVLGAASVQEIWIGLVALVVGLGLLAVVVQLNTRAEATRAWIDRTVQEWRRWR